MHRVAVTVEACWHRVPGGSAVAAVETLRAVRALRPDLDVVGVAARHRHDPAAGLVPPVPVVHAHLPRPLLYDLWQRARVPSIERLSGGPVDVVHATTLVVPPTQAPLVVTVHDIAFTHEGGHEHDRGRRLLERGLELAARHAALVLCSSQGTLDDVARWGLDRRRLRLVPLGVRAQAATADEVAAVRACYGLPERYLLFVGTLEPRKNLPRLLDAVRDLGAAAPPLVLAGPAGWGDVALGPDAVTLGYVPDHDLRALYAGAAAFCFPSLREGFGLPVAEAMAQGAPVVTSAGTTTEEVAGGAAVLVDPHDVGAIAAGITQALDRAAELAAAGRRRAAELTWERTAELTLAAYAEATGTVRA